METGLPDCAICLLAVSSASCETVCGHIFHSNCILRSIRTSPACPLCRTELVEPEKEEHSEDETERLRTIETHMIFDAQRCDRESQEQSLLEARMQWMRSERFYVQCDSEFAEHYSDLMNRLVRTRMYKSLENRRGKAQRDASRAKSTFRRKLMSSVGEIPEGYLEFLLQHLIDSQTA